MKLQLIFAILAFLTFSALAEVYMHEKFGPDWESRWVQSKRDGLGTFVSAAGEFSGDANDSGIKTSQDAHFYALSGKTSKPFTNDKRPFVLQYLVKFEQGIDCGGGYLKVLPTGLDQDKFEGNSKYNVMFGPDICGGTKKIHFILHHKGKNLNWKKAPQAETDKFSHVYTAIINPDDTYEVLVDGQKKESGKLSDDWDFTQPKMIPDPSAKKPADWVEAKEIVDPEDKKPDDWEKPKTIPDPKAEKPSDWNEEEDGKWEPPQIPNPDYRGEWTPRMIPNPEYKGEWKAPQIPNPDYVEETDIHTQPDSNFIGLDLWQVKSGTIFDDFLLTDRVETAAKEREILLEKIKQEKQDYDNKEAEKKKKAEEDRKIQEEESKRKTEEEEKPKPAAAAAASSEEKKDEL
jgi:calreticulin